MLRIAKRMLRRTVRRLGYDIVDYRPDGDAARRPRFAEDCTEQDIATIEAVTPYSMTGDNRLLHLIRATQYIAQAGIPGAMVECDVWRGGSMMAVARTLMQQGDAKRELYLYDTYSGMVEPDERDVDHRGMVARDTFQQKQWQQADGSDWCYASIEEVRANLESTGYEPALMHFVKGKVEQTIPGEAPRQIALLRLDTDWYSSTRHELIHLFPRLSPGGVLIIDDYGHWKGQQQAVDEYFAQEGIHMLLHRVDPFARMAVKLPSPLQP